MGGEKQQSALGDFSGKGSPPHGRGKATYRTGQDKPDGITPAWAGKIFSFAALGPAAEDHPRVGGEKEFEFNVLPDKQGSPPHGRGKAAVTACCLHIHGITPAWAGKRV